MGCDKRVYESKDELGVSLGDFIIEKAKAAILNNGQFTLGVSGGSIINILSDQLVGNNSVEWAKWKIFFCDERYVPESDPESTYGQYFKHVIDKVGFSDSWYPINSELPIAECAADYIKKMKSVFNEPWPRFDLLLLGMGPDGHTCSLFPDHSLLNESTSWIAPITDSPKLPPCRITMTFPVLNNANNVAFVCCGASKGPVLKVIFSKDDKNSSSMPPAGRVHLKDGNLVWFLDKAATCNL